MSIAFLRPREEALYALSFVRAKRDLETSYGDADELNECTITLIRTSS